MYILRCHSLTVFPLEFMMEEEKRVKTPIFNPVMLAELNYMWIQIMLVSDRAMGSLVALSTLLLVLGWTAHVWTLNPDDPNVCSHWERSVYFLSCQKKKNIWIKNKKIKKTAPQACWGCSIFSETGSLHQSLTSILGHYSRIDLAQPESRPGEGWEELQHQMKYAGKLIRLLSSQSITTANRAALSCDTCEK